jgi:hypothetical protein
LNLSDNLTTRDLNDVEKGMVLKRLSTLVQTEEILGRYMPLLGLPKKETLLETYVRIEDLDQDIKTSLARCELSLQTIKHLQEMDQASRITVFEWMMKIKFNINQQKQFIENILDLSNKDGSSVCHLLGEKGLLAIRHDEGMNLPQKAQRLLAPKAACASACKATAPIEPSRKGVSKDGQRIAAASWCEGLSPTLF